MKIFMLGYISAAVMILALACGWDQPNQAAFAPQPNAPCGNVGVVCLDMQGKPNGMCCDEGETCGGGKYSVGCGTPGEQICCDIRSSPAFLKKGTDAGSTHAQLPPR
jgi:hypothetical protein